MKPRLLILFVFVCASALFAGEETADPRALDQFIKGTTAAQQGNPYQAIFFFEEALRIEKSAPFLYVALAEQYIQLAQENTSSEALSRAEENLNKALVLDGRHAPALELKSRLYAAQGKVREARKIVEQLVADHPERREYRIDLLTLCLTSGDFPQVDALYAQLAADSNEHSLDLTRQIAAVYLMAGEHTRALPYMQELSTADTTDAAVAYTLGTLHLQASDTVEAARAVDRAIALDSTDTRYWYLKLVIEFDQDRYDRVLTLARIAEATAGPDARSANLEGLSHMRQGDSTAARERFARALELDSTLYPAAGSLALLYDGIDSLSLAVAYYEHAILHSDSAAIYMNNLAYTYAVRGIESEHAMTLVDAALELEPDNPSYLDTKGWIYYQLGNYSDAMRWLKNALKRDRDSGAILEHMGDVAQAAGKKAQARKYWQQALSAAPEMKSVQEKLAP
ncbi:MAG: tetratricopeptide repeat protein [bacterium]|nr:tetratricopeptide repeat protein [bacterium]